MLPVGNMLLAMVVGGAVFGPRLVLLTLLAAVILFRHRSNLQRLIRGTEYRFERKKVVK
jgi:glycerol-3-phosphate acyltransferase PlsY